MDQLERIRYMERLLDFVIEARKEQPIDPEKSARIQEALRILAEYYTSDDWKQVFAEQFFYLNWLNSLPLCNRSLHIIRIVSHFS